MQGSINFDGTLSGSIAGGGGGGGSEVSITPVLTEGTKIADYTVDSSSGSLYAPEAGDTVEVTPTLNIGDKVADIEVNGVNKALYSQSYSYANDMHDTNSETIGGLRKGSNITPIMVKAVSYADQSGVDGETIGVISVGDTEYAVKQKKANSINYSLTEQDTGKKWIDGRSIYQITLYVQTLNTNNFVAVLGDSNDINIDILVNACGSMTYVSNGARQVVPIPQYFSNEIYIRVYVMSDGSLIGAQYSGKCCVLLEMSGNALTYYNHDLAFTIEYVKAV